MAAAMVLPVVHLMSRALDADDPFGMLRSDRTVDAALSTVWLAVVVTAAACCLGVGLAWVLERTDVPFGRVLGIVAALPLVVPTYVMAVAFKDAFGTRALLFELPGVVGFRGAVMALAVSTYPYVFLVARAALVVADPALDEAARSLGDTRWQAFRRVGLPLLRPAIGAGGLLVFLYVLSDFGAVSILRYETLTMAIFTEYRTSFDRSTPAVLATALVALTVVAVFLERLVRGRIPAARSVSGTRRAPRYRLGAWRWPVAGLVALPAVVGAGIPASVLLYRATLATGRTDSVEVVTRAAFTSVGVSISAALVCAALAVPIAVLIVRHRSRFSAAVETASLAGYALPGLVVGLSLVFFAARYVPGIYQTSSLVVAAYAIRFFPEALGATRSSLVSVDPMLEEAARSLGDSRWAAFRRVTVPLVSPGVVAGAALVFLTAMKELPATLLLRPAGFDTLATRVWTGAAEGFYRQAAPAGLLLLVVSALALGPLVRGAREVPSS